MWYQGIRHNLTKLRFTQASPAWLQCTRTSLQAHVVLHPVYGGGAEDHSWWYALVQSPAAVALSVAVLVVVGGTGVAAQQSLPTDTLYPLKIATERAQLAFTIASSARATVQLKHADERLREARVLSQRGEPGEALAATLARYEGEVQGAASLAAVAPTDSGEAINLPTLVRAQLVQQQLQLQLLRHSAEGRTPKVPERRAKLAQVAVLRALKASSEGELTVFGGVAKPWRQGSMGRSPAATAPPAAFKAAPAFKATGQGMPAVSEALQATALPTLSDREGEDDSDRDVIDPAALAMGAEAEAKVAVAESKIAALEVTVAGSGNQKFDHLLERTREAIREAREALFEAANEGSLSAQREAYRHALRAYQVALEAEIFATQGAGARYQGEDGGNDD